MTGTLPFKSQQSKVEWRDSAHIVVDGNVVVNEKKRYIAVDLQIAFFPRVD